MLLLSGGAVVVVLLYPVSSTLCTLSTLLYILRVSAG